MHNHSAGRINGAAGIAHVERHKHAGGDFGPQEGGRISVALVGNPNVGKSLFFNYLSGMYIDVSNYPGTTIEFITGRYKDFDIVDTPGVYGISSFSDEERVTREVVLQADVILNIIDAAHLERDLFLTLQLIDMGKKVSVFLNCMDEVEKLGLQIDAKRLSDLLGVPIFTTTATTRAGFEQIEAAIENACRGRQDSSLHHQMHAMLTTTGSEAEALLILEGDEDVAQRHGVPAESRREAIYIDRRNQVNAIIDQVFFDKHARTPLATMLGRWALNPWTGIPMLLAALYLIYLFVGKLIAQDLVKFTEVKLGQELWEPWVHAIVTQYIAPTSWLGTLLIGEFGVVTMTVTYLLFLLLPLVIGFYLSLAIMEDSGYLPRLATLVDRSLNAIGLNGNAVIPLILASVV